MPDDGDDLTRIEGIGSVTARALRASGIHTFAELSEANEDVIGQALADHDMRVPTILDVWKDQASLAAREEWDLLESVQHHLHAGRPRPTYFVVIGSLDESASSALLQARITSYWKLSRATPDQVREALLAAGLEPSSREDAWIHSARGIVELEGIATDEQPEDRNRRNTDDREGRRPRSAPRFQPQVAVTGPKVYDRSEAEPPAFAVWTTGAPFFGVELCTEARLFNRARFEADRTPANFFASWSAELSPSSPGIMTYSPPDDVWRRFLAAEKVFYRAWTSANSSHWVNARTSLPDDLAENAPFVLLTGRAEHGPPRRYRPEEELWRRSQA